MSDPMTNLEIQDVLSSIRRLVSEDKRTRPDQRPESRPDQVLPGDRDREMRADDGPATPDKLVLTPALRIKDGPRAEPASQNDSPASPAKDSVDAWNSDAVSDAGGSLEDTIAELEAAVAGAEGQFEPDGSEVAAAPEVDADAMNDVFDDGFEVDVGDDPAGPVIDRAITSGTMADDAADDVELAEDEPAEDEADVSARDDQEQNDNGDASSDNAQLLSGSDDFAFDPANEDEALVADQFGDTDPDHQDNAAAVDEEAVDETDRGDTTAGFVFAHTNPRVRREGKPLILRAGDDQAEASSGSIGRTGRLTLTADDAAGGVEPADPWERDDSPAIQSDEDEDDHLDAAIGAHHETSEPAGHDDRQFQAIGDRGGSADEGVEHGFDRIDAALLRDIVGEVIRAELQGALGERITRNVRTLVRREINRALETRNLGGSSDRD